MLRPITANVPCPFCESSHTHLVSTKIYQIIDESIGSLYYKFTPIGELTIHPTTEHDRSLFIGRPRHAMLRTFTCENLGHEYTVGDMEHKGVMEQITREGNIKYGI